MMKNNNLNWKAYTLDDLREMFKGYEHWFLDGGVALDVFLGRRTRSHGDIDIGVFSTDVEGLLLYLSEKGFDIYEANGGLTQYAPSAHKSSVYNYWVSDGANFIVQVLVYTLRDNRVIFRRNTAMSWPKDAFVLRKDGLQIVNPLITYAFKITNKDSQEKDLLDIDNLLFQLRP